MIPVKSWTHLFPSLPQRCRFPSATSPNLSYPRVRDSPPPLGGVLSSTSSSVPAEQITAETLFFAILRAKMWILPSCQQQLRQSFKTRGRNARGVAPVAATAATPVAPLAPFTELFRTSLELLHHPSRTSEHVQPRFTRGLNIVLLYTDSASSLRRPDTRRLALRIPARCRAGISRCHISSLSSARGNRRKNSALLALLARLAWQLLPESRRHVCAGKVQRPRVTAVWRDNWPRQTGFRS